LVGLTVRWLVCSLATGKHRSPSNNPHCHYIYYIFSLIYFVVWVFFRPLSWGNSYIILQHIRRTPHQYNHLGTFPQVHQHCYAVRIVCYAFWVLFIQAVHRWSAALPSILGSRLLLNMRERAYRTEVYTGATEGDGYRLSTLNAAPVIMTDETG
jgi:hypothetical protein